MLRTLSLIALIAGAFAGSADAQKIVLITEESFDYPNGSGLHDLNGGVGWANAWWSNGDPVNSAATVEAPSLDAVGNKVVDSDAGNPPVGIGSYRFPSVFGFEHMADANLLWGEDGTSMWISFLSRRAPGADPNYGGISLYEQFVAERLFIGAPAQQFFWGIYDYAPMTPQPETIPGTNIDQLTQIVVRIDHMAGDERLRMWIDPAVPHPDTPADLDTTIGDLRWNELGFKSGNPTDPSTHGWWFDGIRLETYAEGFGTPFCYGDGSGLTCPCGNNDPNAASGGCANGTGEGAILSATGSPSVMTDSVRLYGRNLLPFQPCLFFQGDNAINGGGGSAFGDGLRCAGQNVIRLEVVAPDADGCAETSVLVAAKGGVNGGETKYYQVWYRDPAGSPCGALFNLSNALEINWEM